MSSRVPTVRTTVFASATPAPPAETRGLCRLMRKKRMHEPTPEKAALVEPARDSDRNLLLSALAGAAKTSTLELIAAALPDTEILALAFNKAMAVEMQERMPSNVKAMTLNALGHRTWMDATGRRLKINSSKTYEIVDELVRY